MIVQAVRAENPPSPAKAAGVISFWTIFAFLSVLTILVLVLIVGIRRKHRLSQLGKRKPGRTRHVDAWTEAGQRIKTPEDLDDLIDSPPPDPHGNFGPDSRSPGDGNRGGGWDSGKSGGPRE